MKKRWIVVEAIWVVGLWILSGCGASDGSVNESRGPATVSSAQIGDTVVFGAYEQDNDPVNGKENIEWMVLDQQEGRILVISRYALDGKSFYGRNTGMSWEEMTWKNCMLREWLNDDFLNTAFSDDEQKRILTVTLTDPTDNVSPSGSSTQDKVFLLSVTEAGQYFASQEERKTVPTKYAATQRISISQKQLVDGEGTCDWWLRTPRIPEKTASVSTTGKIIVDMGGNRPSPDIYNYGVRPALWISTD